MTIFGLIRESFEQKKGRQLAPTLSPIIYFSLFLNFSWIKTRFLIPGP